MRILVAIMILNFSISAIASDDSITLIANDSVTINSPLTIQTLRDIYLLKKLRWPDAQPIIFINRQSEDPVRQRLEKIVGIDSKEYILYLKKMHYKGKTLPIIQNSQQAIMLFVEKIPGSLAYIKGDLPEKYKNIKKVGFLN